MNIAIAPFFKLMNFNIAIQNKYPAADAIIKKGIIYTNENRDIRGVRLFMFEYTAMNIMNPAKGIHPARIDDSTNLKKDTFLILMGRLIRNFVSLLLKDKL